jgi:ion channel-forming bestrophin family protein
MHVGKSYSLRGMIAWTRRRGYVLLALSLVPVAAFVLLGWHWIAIPWPVAALLGTATSFIVGFKNAQTYGRTTEATQVLCSLVFVSRYWGLLCRDLPTHRTEFERLIRRHLAWLTVLRYEARRRRVWETTEDAANAEYRRRHFVVPERETPMEQELARHLGEQELLQVRAANNKATWLIAMQSEALRSLYQAQELVVLHHTEMQKTLKDMLDYQARIERIKGFPYPRQYAVVNSIFVWAFAAVLPFCLVAEFDKLNHAVTGALAGHMAWLAVPFSVLLAWLYTTLDQVGESTENPFEGGANDVPITQVCRMIEAELRPLLGEPAQPLPSFDGPIVL